MVYNMKVLKRIDMNTRLEAHEERRVEEDTNTIINDYYREMNDMLSELANELDCSLKCATDVWYLRTRSRWTQELEDKLISLHDTGMAPNMCEFE